MKSKIVAISAISSSLVAISLTFASYFSVATLIGLVLTSIFVILPLYYNSYKGAFLSFLIGGILAVLFSGFNFLSVVFPAYFLFFGAFPIVYFLANKKAFNKYIVAIIGVIWCLILVYGTFYFYTVVLGLEINFKFEIINKFITIFLGIGAVGFYFFFVAYIKSVRIFIDKYLSKVFKANDKK